ncbi:MAG: hypothetical protein Kow0049_12730 [Stanieria sp.]
MIPISLRENVLTLSQTITKVEVFPESVYSITLFPYLILFVAIASWLYRYEKSKLALFGEWLTLCFGIFLTLLSWYNPTWRSLNLLLSTVTLGYVATIRQPLRIGLIYFTHLLGLVTASSIYSGRENKTISYLALAGITLAIYELAIYQMTQSAGGSLADALTILAFVAAVIAIFYRILAFWWREQPFLFNFSLNQIIITAHLHWAIASILKIIAAGIAIETVTPRLTLLSIGISFCLGAYAIIQGRDIAPTSKIIDPLVIGLSCLYIAQFDLKLQTRQQLRHYFRLFGSGLICVVALILYQKTGIIPSAIALIFILAGLGLSIRAFLYIGTITFILTIIYQLIILIFTYSFLKWIVGLIAGIVAIAIAANFERKSIQITNTLQNYLAQLQQWQ